MCQVELNKIGDPILNGKTTEIKKKNYKQL